MRVAQLLVREGLGGAETLVETLRNEWRKTGVAETETLYLEGSRPLSRFARLRRLRRELREGRYDVLLAHSALPMVYGRLCAPRGTRIVCVLHSLGREYEDRGLYWAERITALRKHVLVAVANPVKAEYVARFGRAEKDPTMPVIPNPATVGVSAPLVLSEVPLVVTVARFTPVRDPELWLEAALCLHRAGIAVRFEWWGPVQDPEWAEPILRRFEENSDVVAWMGSTQTKDEVYGRGHIYLNTGLRDAQGIAMYEAACAGMPVVLPASVAGVDARLARSPYGARDPESVAEAIVRVLSAWPEYRASAAAQASYIAADYSAASCATRYADILTSSKDAVH